MTLLELNKKLRPFVKPYHFLVFATLLLTLVGSFAAQVNAWILRYTVDGITEISTQPNQLSEGWKLLQFITVILLGKEIINAFVQFGQKY